MKRIFLSALIAATLSSCFQQYYKTNTTAKIFVSNFDQQHIQNKVIIVHTPAEAFMLKNVKIDNESVTGEKEILNPKYDKYMNPEVNAANRYLKKEKDIALSEVHIYTNNSFEGNQPVNLPMNQIYRLDNYDKDISATRRSRVLSVVGIVTPVVVGAIVVGAAAAQAADNMQNIPLNINFN
jgi:carboxypeptidase C (cathepsin A)